MTSTISLVDVQAVLARRHLPGERADTGDHLAGAIAVLHDAAERLTRFFDGGGIGAEPAQAGACVRDDGGNGLAHLMRDRGRHLPERGHPVDVRQIGFAPAQGVLGPFLLAHVAVGLEDRRGRPGSLRCRDQRLATVTCVPSRLVCCSSPSQRPFDHPRRQVLDRLRQNGSQQQVRNLPMASARSSRRAPPRRGSST